MLRKAEENKDITGFLITRGGLQLSHLFFADDSLLFCKATVGEWTKMKGVLDAYERASGQKLNKEKTYLFQEH